MTLTTPVTEWRIDLPLTRPMSLNDRDHWRTKAAKVAALRRAVMLLAQSKQIPPCSHIEVRLHYAPRDSRRRDSINLVPTLKACEDGLVDAGIIPDDTPVFCTSVMPIIDPPIRARTGHLYLIITVTERTS